MKMLTAIATAATDTTVINAIELRTNRPVEAAKIPRPTATTGTTVSVQYSAASSVVADES